MWTQPDLIDHAIPRQLMLGLADRQVALWRVAMTVCWPDSIPGPRRSSPVTWESYAVSSVDACGKAIAWALDQAAEISDEAKVRVLEVLQVGT